MAGTQSPLRQLARVVVEEPPPQSLASSIVTMMNSAIGAGVLTLPYAFRVTGWAAGLACLLGVAAVMSYSLYILCRCAERTGSKTYGSLVQNALGWRVSMYMAAIKVLFLFGGCCSYLMILGDSFNPLLVAAFGATWWTSRSAAIVAVGCAAILPLCLRTSLGSLRAVSSAAVGAVLVVVGAVVFSSVRRIRRPDHTWAGVQAFNPSLEAVGALPLIIFSYISHHNVISVLWEMGERPGLHGSGSTASADAGTGSPGQPAACAGGEPGGEPGYQSLPAPRALAARSMRRLKSGRLRGMVVVIAASMGLVSLLYALIGLAGYLAFPTDANPDILLSFGCTNQVMQVARACIGLVLIASYPVVHFPARASISELLHHATGLQFVGTAFIALEAVAFFGATLAVALLCTDLGVVFKLIGGTCGTVMVLGMPGALLTRHAYERQAEARQQMEALLEPLLAAAAGEGVATAQQEKQQRQQRQGYSLWRSRLFWSGVGLQLLAAAVAVLSMVTVLWRL